MHCIPAAHCGLLRLLCQLISHLRSRLHALLVTALALVPLARLLHLQHGRLRFGRVGRQLLDVRRHRQLLVQEVIPHLQQARQVQSRGPVLDPLSTCTGSSTL